MEKGFVNQGPIVATSTPGGEAPHMVCDAPTGSRPTGDHRKEAKFRTEKLGLYRKTRGKQSKYAQEVRKVIKPGSLGGYQDHNRKNKGQWRGIARTSRTKELLYDTATMVGHISVEATQAAHYHVYRCLEEGIDLGKMDYNNFWNYIFDAIKDLRYGDGLKQDIRTPLYDSLRQYAEEAPLPQAGESLRWDVDGHTAWRRHCLKAAADAKAQNLHIILHHNAYHNLCKIVKVRLARTFGARYADDFRSLVSAVAAAVWEDVDFRGVKEGYDRLKNLTEEEVRDIQETIVNPIREKFPDQEGRKENAKMMEFVHFVAGEVMEYNRHRSEQSGPGSPPQAIELVNICVGEKLAVAIERDLRKGSLTKKEFVHHVKHALDIFRQCSGPDLFTTRTDQGFRSGDNGQRVVDRNDRYRGQILCLLSERILYQSQKGGAEFLSQDQVGWIDGISSELRLPSSLADYDMTKNDFADYMERVILPKLRSSFLFVAPRRGNDAKAPWGKRIQVPSVLPLAKKRACHISIPNVAITGLAEGLALECSDIAEAIHGPQETLREARQRVKSIESRIVDMDKENWLTDEQQKVKQELDENKKKSKLEFEQTPTGKRHRYKKSDKEKKLCKEVTDRKNALLNGSQEYLDAREEVEKAALRYQECCWTALFNIKVRRCQNGHQWLFGGQLSTDGVDVSMQYYRLKTDDEIRADEEEKERIKARAAEKATGSSTGKPRKRKRTSRAGPGTPQSSNVSSRGNLDRAKDLLAASPDNAWVFDPGPDGHVGIRLEQGKMRELCQENKRHGDYDPFETMSLTNHEMQSRAGILKRKALERAWSQARPGIGAWKQEAPTRKVGTARDMLAFCRTTNSHLNTVYGFYSQNCFRRQRFSVYTRTQRMLDSMVERICGTKDREAQSKTVVVFGDASINSGKHGKQRVCFRALKDLLRQRCCFIEIGEFRSSQYCCACHAKLEDPPAVGLHKRWKVRRCMNNGCERAFWQRDVNAAINLAKFFLLELNGEEKPTVFQRPRTRAEEDIPDV